MNAPVTRRSILQAGSAALGAAALPVGITAALAAEASPIVAPLAFDPAAFVADLKTAGYNVIASYAVPRGGEPAGPPSYFIRPPKGRGFGEDFRRVMAKWSDALEACPEHVERVANHVFEHIGRGATAGFGAMALPALTEAGVPASDADDADADLYTALDRWEAIDAGRTATWAAFETACARAEAAYPPRPAALRSGIGDQRTHLGVCASGREAMPDGRVRSFFDFGDVDKLRAVPPVRRWATAASATERPRREPDPEGEARRQEILRVHDRWQAERRAIQDAAGWTTAQAAVEAEVHALNAAEDHVKLCPPRTMAGLRRKAAWVARLLTDEGAADDLAEVFVRQVAAFGAAA